MTRHKSALLIIVGIVSLLAATISIYVTSKRRSVASLIARTRYAIFFDGAMACTNPIPQNIALELANKVLEHSSVKILGKKSIDYGGVYLLDGYKKPILNIDILEYPLFEMDGKQIELHYDLVGACGFSIPEYEIPVQTTPRKEEQRESPP